MKTLLLNFKNYTEGRLTIDLARAAERSAWACERNVIIAPPLLQLSQVAERVTIPVYAQKIDLSVANTGKNTGRILAESVLSAGGKGAIINHPECHVSIAQAKYSIDSAKNLGLETCVCCQDLKEAKAYAATPATRLAFEPLESIGTGSPVSNRPRLLTEVLRVVKEQSFNGEVLCGGSLSDASQVRRVTDMGFDGVLVASSVAQAKDWRAKLTELLKA